MLKKALALTLALLLTLSTTAFAGISEDVYADANQINDDARSAVELMYALRIMVGDGMNFHPNEPITRAMMSKILYVILNGGDDGAVNYVGNSFFSDVPANKWYNGYVNYCAITKKIQGYNGKFDPNGILTSVAAAKMLLTAIGYDAERYGLVGDDWEENTLKLAYQVGLLQGYENTLRGAAQRQWVAKMIVNSFDAYTYQDDVPSGILPDGVLSTITTFGEKYLSLDTVQGIFTATQTVSLTDGDLSTNGARFETANGKFVLDLKNVPIEYLGQEFRIYYNTRKNTAYYLQPLSVTAEGRLSQWRYDRIDKDYTFILGDTAFEMNSKTPILYSGITELGSNTTFSPATFAKRIDNGAADPDLWKLIDTDADGTVDQIVVTEFDYAQVTKTGTSGKYGDYCKLADLSDDSQLSYDNNKNLYLNRYIITEEDLKEDDIIRYTWDLEKGCFRAERLPVFEAEFRSSKDGLFELSGEDFLPAEDCQPGITTVFQPRDLGKTYHIATDGDLLIWCDAAPTAFGYLLVTDLSELRADNTCEKVTALLHDKEVDREISVTNNASFLLSRGEYTYYAYALSGNGQYTLSDLTVTGTATVLPESYGEMYYASAPEEYREIIFDNYDIFSMQVAITELVNEKWESVEKIAVFSNVEDIWDFVEKCENNQEDEFFRYSYDYRFATYQNPPQDRLFVMIIEISKLPAT